MTGPVLFHAAGRVLTGCSMRAHSLQQVPFEGLGRIGPGLDETLRFGTR